jgi:hypothetical protein
MHAAKRLMKQLSADTEFLSHTAIGDSCNSQNKENYRFKNRKPSQGVINQLFYMALAPTFLALVNKR